MITPPYKDETGRVCSKCDKYKLWNEFNKNKQGFNGYRPDCRDCQKKQAKNYKRDPAKNREAVMRWYYKKKAEGSHESDETTKG